MKKIDLNVTSQVKHLTPYKRYILSSLVCIIQTSACKKYHVTLCDILCGTTRDHVSTQIRLQRQSKYQIGHKSLDSINQRDMTGVQRSADLVEFHQDLAGDLNVILLNVLQRDDDTFVEADVGEDLSGTSSDTRHRPTLR